MATRLIETGDGILIEVEVPEDQVEAISGGFSERVDTTFEQVKPLLTKACKPIIEVWKELNKEIEIAEAAIEIGLSFEGEGNIYITKSKASANLTVSLLLKPKD